MQTKLLALCLALGGTVAALLQWVFVMYQWEALEDLGQAEVTANATARVARYRGDDWYEKPMWYYQTAHYGLGSMLSSFGFFMLPIFALTGFRCILNKRTLLWMCTALSSVGMVFVVAFAMFSLYSNDGLGYSIYLVFAFFINVPLVFVPAMMTGSILRDRVRAPYCLATAITITINILGVVLLAVIFPLANDGSTLSRLIVRIVGFTIAVEALALIMRSCTHKNVFSQFPTDRLIMLQVGIMLVPAILGRQLATQMPTSLGTVFLSVGLLMLEIGMRYTLVKRDTAILSCLGRLMCCGTCATCLHGKQGVAMAEDADRPRVAVRMWIAYMTAESILEDTGIFLSLPIATIFRQPPVPGTLPLGVGEVFFRVFIQVVVELLADALPTIFHCCMRRVLGYRVPVVMMEMLHDYVDMTNLRLSYKKKSSIAAPPPRTGATVAPYHQFSPLTEQQDAAITLDQLNSGAEILFVQGPSHSTSASAGEVSSGRSTSLDGGNFFASAQDEADPASVGGSELPPGDQRSVHSSQPARLASYSRTATMTTADQRTSTALSDDDPGDDNEGGAVATSGDLTSREGQTASRIETGATAATAAEVYMSDSDMENVRRLKHATPQDSSSGGGSSNPVACTAAPGFNSGTLSPPALSEQGSAAGVGDGGIGPHSAENSGGGFFDGGMGGLGGLQDAFDDQQAEQAAATAQLDKDKRREGEEGGAGGVQASPQRGVVSVHKFSNDAPCGCLELKEDENKQAVLLYLDLLQETAPEVNAERQAIWTELSFHQMSALLVAAAISVDEKPPSPTLGNGEHYIQDVMSQELYPEGHVETSAFSGSGGAVPDERLLGYAIRAVLNHRASLQRAHEQAVMAASVAAPEAAAGRYAVPPAPGSPIVDASASVSTRSISGPGSTRVPDVVQATASGMLDDSAQAIAAAAAANRQRGLNITDEENKPYLIGDLSNVRHLVESCGLGATVDASGKVSIGRGYWIAAQAELMAQRSVHAWETRFLFFTLMMFVFVFIGSQYALRTTQPALCPFFTEGGSAHRPTSWYFDNCIGGEEDTAR